MSVPPSASGLRCLAPACALATLLLLASCGADTPAAGVTDVSVGDAGPGSDAPAQPGACAVDSAPCDDGDPCTQGDRCAQGACVPGPNTCQCSGDGDCAALDDGDACNGTLVCDLQVFPYRCRTKPGSVVVCSGTGTQCAAPACDPKTGACGTTPRPDGTPCSDANPCTVESACKAGVCEGGAASWCACETTADCASLSQGDLCGGDWFCDTGTFPYSCQRNPASVVACSSSKDTTCSKNACDPKTGTCAPKPVEALLKVCDPGLPCRWVPAPKGAEPTSTLCDDADPCTQNEQCQGGACTGGVDLCACSKDADCDGQEDGDLCNGTLYCDVKAGACKLNPATVVTCSPEGDTACVKNTCHSATGLCAQLPVKPGTACDDGDGCTQGEICKAGACGGGTNLCPCAKDADCASKEDGDACNGTLYCDKSTGTCLLNPTTAVTCPSVDDTDCVKAACVPATGQCAPKAVADGAPCDDGDSCTKGEICAKGSCGGGTAVCTCKSDQDCVAKDDGDLCNGVYFCNKALKLPACEFNPATTVTCPTVGDTACLKQTCVPQTGQCVPQPAKTGAACSDGDPCTVSDFCLGGLCQSGTDTCECHTNADCVGKDDGDLCNGTWYCDKSGTKPACKPNPASKVYCSKAGDTACLVNLCDTKTGACGLQPKTDGSPCPDSDPCVKAAACKGGQCTAQGKTDCNDGNPCTVDTCAKTGCAHQPVPCDDGKPCTLDTCDAKTGQCSAQAGPLQGKGCDADGNGCTVNDFCDKGACTPGVSAVCGTSSQPCTQRVCVSASASAHTCVTVPSPDGATCSAGAACSLGDTCKAGTCVAGTADKLFHKERLGSGKPVRYVAVANHPKGGWVAVGATLTGPNAGAWLIDRLDAQGQPVAGAPLLLSTPGSDAVADADAVAVDVQPTASGVAVAGAARTQSSGWQVRVVGLAADGKTLAWDQTHGGALDERAAALAPLPGGGWAVAGQVAKASAQPSQSEPDGLALRLSATGLLLGTWTQAKAGAQRLAGVVGTGDGGALLVGSDTPAGGVSRAWVVRLDGGWKALWTQSHGGSAAQGLTAVTSLGARQVAVGWRGAPVSNAWWVDLDALGKIRSQGTTSTPSAAYAVIALGPDTVALAGGRLGSVATGWLAAVDGQSHLLWQRESTLGHQERLAAVAQVPDGGLVAVGTATPKGGTARGVVVRADPWGRSSCASAGVCAAKTLKDCADSSVCTDDLCDAKQGCTPAHNTLGCDDGDACTALDSCQAGACAGGTKTHCDDANTCTADACDKTKGCVHTPAAGATCVDNDVCTTKETCVGGVCQLQTTSCDDQEPCTVDACDKVKGCVHAAKPDDTPCGTGKVCLLGTCTKRWAASLTTGSSTTGVVTPDGKVLTWGYASYSALGRPGSGSTPTALPNLPPAKRVVMNGLLGCALTQAGQVYCWGAGPHGIGCGVPSQAVPVPVVKWPDVATDLAIGNGGRVCVVAKKGVVRCWGVNGWGACGVGVKGSSICTPDKTMVGVTDAVQVASGTHYTCVRLASGKVQCLGASYVGTLGDGGAISHLNQTSTVRDTKGLTDAVDLSGGNTHLCAVRAQGSVVCWGANSVGQLGNGTLKGTSTPTPVFGLSDATAVAAGNVHTCALRKGGTVVCWGGNTSGQLGIGTTFKSIAPLPVQGLDGVVALSAGDAHTCALRKNGEVRCWGANNAAQLGTQKSGGISTTPVAVKASVP